MANKPHEKMLKAISHYGSANKKYHYAFATVTKTKNTAHCKH